MRTNWVATGVGVWLAVVAGLTRLQWTVPPTPTPEEQASQRMDELINQSEGGGQIGSFLLRDPRSWWQRWVDPAAWVFPKYPTPSHLTPERLHEGIM